MGTGDVAEAGGRPALPGYVFRTGEVVRTEMITSRTRRITLGGPELAGFGEDRWGPNVKIYVPLPHQRRPVLPVLGDDGIARWPPQDERPTMRTYTVRHYDPSAQELQLDFVLHEPGGVASDWAKNADVGSCLGITGPGGRTVGPADWYLLAGDESALPALAVLSEKFSRDARGIAFVEVGDESDRVPLNFPAGVETRWLYRRGAPAGRTTLLADAVREAAIPQDRSVFAWVSAESSAVRTLRQHFRQDIGLDKASTLTIGYWKAGLRETDYSRLYDNDRDPERPH